MARKGRPNRLAPHTHPLHLFITGILVIVCFLFQQNLFVRIGEVALFAVLAILAGKRIRWGYFVIMVVSITLFNLLTPVGEVLVRLGPLVITRGALEQGLMKAFAIPGLVFISLFAVRPDLRLPGRFGGLVARLFFYFEHVLEGRKQIRIRRFVETVDTLLLSVLEASGGAGQPTEQAVRPAQAPAVPTQGGAVGAGACAGTDLTGLAFMVLLVGGCLTVGVIFGGF